MSVVTGGESYESIRVFVSRVRVLQEGFVMMFVKRCSLRQQKQAAHSV